MEAQAPFSEVFTVTMVLADPGSRDFMIDIFLEDWERGRSTIFDGKQILAALRLLGDVARLERLARTLNGRDNRRSMPSDPPSPSNPC